MRMIDLKEKPTNCMWECCGHKPSSHRAQGLGEPGDCQEPGCGCPFYVRPKRKEPDAD